MADPDRSTDVSANEAIATVKGLDVASIRGFVEGDERVTVQEAAEARYESESEAPVADGLPTPAGTIGVDQITALQGFVAPPESVTRTGETLTGTETLKGKVTVRTRYPVDVFETDDATITAAGVKVDASKLTELVTEANRSGVTLERI